MQAAGAVMRVYVHHNEFTWLYVGSGSEAVSDVAQQFARVHAAHLPAAGLAGAALELHGADGAPLAPGLALREAAADGADLTAVLLASPPPPAALAAATPVAAGALAPGVARELMQRAAELAARKQLRDSSDIYDQARRRRWLRALGSASSI